MKKIILSAVLSTLSLITICELTTQKVYAAKIIVGHDVNTFGSRVANSEEENFAVNVANFLTTDSPDQNILLYESNPGDGSRNFSIGVIEALSDEGFSITLTSDYQTPFSGFDAIFVAQDFPTVDFLDNTDLIDFVDSGGGVYLAGGVGGDGPSAEAAGWNTFLGNYGLAFAPNYNSINNVVITNTHPIFAGVNSLRSGNGQSIINLGTHPNSEIVQFSGSQGVYAVVDTPSESIPEPSSIVSLLTLVTISLNAKLNHKY
ncbi:MAG: hypothetical protein AAGG51_04125 [Cyanobacteria bacterium P01_G01_bin.54]